MLRLRHKLLLNSFLLLDVVVLIGTLSLLASFKPQQRSVRDILEAPFIATVSARALESMVLFLSWAVILKSIVRYDSTRFAPLSRSLRDVLKATFLCALVVFLVGRSFGIMVLGNRTLLLFWFITTVLVMASRVALRLMLVRLSKSGHYCRYVVIVGAPPAVTDIRGRIGGHPELGYRITGVITDESVKSTPDDAANPDSSSLACVGELKTFLADGTVDEVMICWPLKDKFKEIASIVSLCHEAGVVVRVLPEIDEAKAISEIQVEVFDGRFVVTFFREARLWQLLFKRGLDVVVSLSALLILSPLLIAVAILVKTTSPGPVFFIQERVGMNRRKFKFLKFRSMVVNAEQIKKELAALNEQEGPIFKMKDDPRLTPIGRWIRRASIDELPQLINVLRGEMSLVGPRPPLPHEVDQYNLYCRRRLSVRPGITCLWQISGRSDIPFVRWMELDREYIENWSIWLDLVILVKTIPAVLSGKGAC